MKTVSFTPTESAHLTAKLSVIGVNPYSEPLEAGRMAARVMLGLPSVKTKLMALIAVTDRAEILRLRNGPLDNLLCPTPVAVASPPEGKTTFVTELFLLGLARLAGLDVFGYDNEKAGAFLHQVCPVPGKEETISSNGSGNFGLHTEGPHLRHAPEFFFLYCLRGNREAMSPLVRLEDIEADLSGQHLDVLMQPRFLFRAGDSYDGPKEPIAQPILYHAYGQPCIRYHDHNVTAMIGDFEAAGALIALRKAVERNQVWTVLYPGDLVFFSNETVLHGRTGFPVEYDGNQRWLQRCYLTRDFNKGPVADEARRVWRG